MSLLGMLRSCLDFRWHEDDSDLPTRDMTDMPTGGSECQFCVERIPRLLSIGTPDLSRRRAASW